MTAPTRSSIILFSATVSAGSTTKQSAAAASTPTTGNGGWVDISAYNGGDIGWAITNGASAPGAALQFSIQFASANNSPISSSYDRWTGAGNVVAGDTTSGIVPIPTSAKFVRVLAWGNTTNGVSMVAEALLKA